MNKSILRIPATLMLVAALAACGQQPTDGTLPTDGSTADSVQVTEPSDTSAASAESTPPETTAPAPAPLPDVKDGTIYTKQAIDSYGFGGLDFLHSLTIPRIDSTKPGAEALNAKILADQQEKLDQLAADKEENYLYTVAYSTSGADGILVINVFEYIGWQYSEGGSSNRFYYYDAAADCELSLDEVLTRLSLTAEALNKAMAWSSEYAAISIEFSDRTVAPADAVFGAPIVGAYDGTAFCFAETQNGNEIELLGIDFDETTVSPCYRYAVYTVASISCPIDRASGAPLHPYYTCTLLQADLTAGDALRITVADGKVTEAVVPADAKISGITVSSNVISILYDKDSEFDFSALGTVLLNGKGIRTGFDSSLTETEEVCIRYSIPLALYVSPDKLETVELRAE